MMYDALLLLLLLYAGYKGYQKGFIQAILSFVGYLLGLWIAVKCSAWVAEHSSASSKWMPFVVFFLMLIAVGWMVHIIAKTIRGLMSLIMLGWIDGIAGMLVYLLLSSFVISLFIFFLTSIQLLNLQKHPSQLMPLLEPLGPGIIKKADSITPLAKDSFESLKNFFSQASPKIEA